MHFTKVFSAISLLSAVGSAHPGHNVAEEAAERRSFLDSVKRSSLAHCSEKLKARGVEDRNIQRRQNYLEAARMKKRSLQRRDLDSVLATSHNETGVTPNLDADSLFAGNHSCVLTPEVTQGPYFWKVANKQMLPASMYATTSLRSSRVSALPWTTR